ncbi:MAG: acyl-CoA dehydrogenase [Gammaproteobacteria bacterium]
MIWFIITVAGLWALAYFKTPLRYATAAVAAGVVVYTIQNGFNAFGAIAWLILLLALVPLNVPELRQRFVSKPVLDAMRSALPKVSQTEREALEAGTVWWDAEIFSGHPNWERLHRLPAPAFSPEEQAFIDGPTEELCRMLDDWQITHEIGDLPPEIWQFLARNKFFAMDIPKRYGGLEFSALGHAQVVMKISSRSTTAAVSVMVPNSLGPAKLLLEYGTEEQKDYYLPRLAAGDEIPAFALTGPEAGSDAGAIPDNGIVCHGEFEGRKNVLGIRLNWKKRYITLGPVATVLGLAFKLYDPDRLLGDVEDVGITVALIPTDTPGVVIGNRHIPLNIPFMNGPNRGHDVFVPIDWIIGGQPQIGKGWKMLMDCLADGRAISLPALSMSAGKVVSRFTGAYARVRRQFNLPIGRFEGIEEVLARIAGTTYMMDAGRTITALALDAGEKPAVISAILKYHLTEEMRRIINFAMDIHGGSGICLGPRNYIGRSYQAIPIGITVEGANIMTRSLIIFGQGAIRCHPFLQEEIDAAQMSDHEVALPRFDTSLFGHIDFLLGNLARATWLSVTNARFVDVPGNTVTKRYYRQINRLSASFALAADVALLTLGGTLKRKERLSGRFADVLSYLYLTSATLKHYRDQGEQEADVPLLRYACRYAIYRAQQSLLGVFWNLPLKPLAVALRWLLFPFGKPYSPPDDKLISQAAGLLLDDSPVRDRLTAGIYINDTPGDPTGRIEHAFKAVLKADAASRKLREAVRQGTLVKRPGENIVDKAAEAGVLNDAEAALVRAAKEATMGAISVDDFSPEELSAKGSRQNKFAFLGDQAPVRQGARGANSRPI